MAKSKKKYRIQPRIPGLRREPALSCVVPEVMRRLENDSAKYGVRRSWVQAVILAKHYKIDIPEY